MFSVISFLLFYHCQPYVNNCSLFTINGKLALNIWFRGRLACSEDGDSNFRWRTWCHPTDMDPFSKSPVRRNGHISLKLLNVINSIIVENKSWDLFQKLYVRWLYYSFWWMKTDFRNIFLNIETIKMNLHGYVPSCI